MPIEDRLGMAGDDRNTTTFHVVDRYGNAAAVTTSLGVSSLIAGETGIHMNERLTFMHKDADDINRVAKFCASMWQRAQLSGARAALNIGHSEEETEEVTKMQRDAIFPILKQELTGRETTVLDYGCGPG